MGDHPVHDFFLGFLLPLSSYQVVSCHFRLCVHVSVSNSGPRSSLHYVIFCEQIPFIHIALGIHMTQFVRAVMVLFCAATGVKESLSQFEQLRAPTFKIQVRYVDVENSNTHN